MMLLLSSAPLTARAQSRPETLHRNADAVVSGQRGLEAFRNREWAAAYSLFHEAETLAHSPVFLLYMARARARVFAFAEALDLYARVMREPVNEQTPDSWRSAVEQGRREAAALQRRLMRNDARKGVAPVESPEAGETSGTAPKAALAAGAAGLAGIAMGLVAGIVAWSQLNDVKARCEPTGCNPADKSKLDSVQTWARLSDIGFVVGGTGLATSAVFLWVVPAASRAAPGRAGFSARVSF